MTSFVSVDKKWCVSKAIIAIVSQREVCEIDGSLVPAMGDPVSAGGGGGGTQWDADNSCLTCFYMTTSY